MQSTGRRLIAYGLLFCGLLTVMPAAEAFRPGELWPDDQGVHINAHGGGILFHEGMYYWFGQHMVAGEAGNKAQVGIGVYSSKDLYHWKNEGIALPVRTDAARCDVCGREGPGGTASGADAAGEIGIGCIMERPKVIYNQKTGKFVMWFHLELPGQGYGAARSGVAVADHPTGPYHYQGSLRPNAGHWPANEAESNRQPLSAEESEQLGKLRFSGGKMPDYPAELLYRRDHQGGQMARDMGLFVDDDGKTYHMYSSEENGTLHISRLSDDYLRPTGEYYRVFPGRFNEAPAMLKHQGKYYLFTSDCTGWEPNAARLAVADSIQGPWRELGNPCRGSEEQVNRTFDSQSTFILPVHGKPNAYIFMADRWRPENAIDGRHVWLPIRFEADGAPFLEWRDTWDLGAF